MIVSSQGTRWSISKLFCANKSVAGLESRAAPPVKLLKCLTFLKLSRPTPFLVANSGDPGREGLSVVQFFPPSQP